MASLPLPLHPPLLIKHVPVSGPTLEGGGRYFDQTVGGRGVPYSTPLGSLLGFARIFRGGGRAGEGGLGGVGR